MPLTALGFLALFFGGLFLAFTRHPAYGLFTYEITFYLHPPARWWGESLPDLRWSLLSALVTFFAYLAYARKVPPQHSFLSHGCLKALLLFTLWLWLQLLWALEFDLHFELAVLFTKYLVLLFLILRVLDTPERLRLFLWVHVIGCFIMGWVAYTDYTGGRFEGFGPPNVSEANAGALQLVTGVYTVAALFLYERRWARIALFLAMPFIVNGIITTISRSGFLELGAGGLIFFLFTPPSKKKIVIALSALGVLGALGLTSATYWNRIDTLSSAGENIEGEDTGYGRVVLMKAQWEMFKAHPFGTGHRGTATLSPLYLPEKYLTGAAGKRGRSSHNTFMTLLVEQGIFGVFFYVYLVWWTLRTLIRTKRVLREGDPLLALALTAIAAGLGAIFVGDMFVDYLKLESRYWFIGLLLILPRLARSQDVAPSSLDGAAPARRHEPGL